MVTLVISSFAFFTVTTVVSPAVSVTVVEARSKLPLSLVYVSTVSVLTPPSSPLLATSIVLSALIAVLSELIRLLTSLSAESVAMVTFVRLLQPSNAPLPMLVTLSPMVTDVRFMQLLNATTPMLVTLSGMATSVRL